MTLFLRLGAVLLVFVAFAFASQVFCGIFQSTPPTRYGSQRAINTVPPLFNLDNDSPNPDDYHLVGPEEYWKSIRLVMQKHDGSECRMNLLRPMPWLRVTECEVGNRIFIDLPEMGLRGYATVERVSPCPKLGHPTDGASTVIGTFVTSKAKVLDLYIEGLGSPIGTTSSHPYWSITRDDWVEASGLRANELLRTKFGDARVKRILPRPGRHSVYNLQVHQTKTYYVSNIGVLVHNSYVSRPFPVGSRAYRVPRSDQEKWIRNGAVELAGYHGRDPGGLKISRQIMEGQIINAGGNPKLFVSLLDEVFGK